jgi:hypothetical protein
MPIFPKPLSASDLYLRWLPLIAFSAVIAYYFWFVSSYAINVPHHDDIYDFLQFVKLVESADSTEAAIKEWFRQYNDHRTGASRLQVYGAYLVEGEVNFRTLTLLGNLALPLILLLFYLNVRGERYRWVFLLVSALLLLNMRSYTIAIWSQPAFAYYYVFFYAFACLFTLHKVTWPKFVLAAIFCTLSSFTFASGQVVWVLGLASLLHQCWVTGQKRPIYPLMWLLTAVAMLIVWRIGFTGIVPETLPEDSVELSAGVPKLIFKDALIDPSLQQLSARYITYFLVLLGSAFIDFSTLWAAVVGLFMLAVLSFLSVRFYKHEDIRLVLCCWFIVTNAAAVTLGRAILFDPHYILGMRYSFFSVLLTCTMAMLVQVKFRVFKGPAVLLFVLLAGVYSAWGYRHFEDRLQVKMEQRYKYFNAGVYPTFGKSPGESGAITREAISAGIYKPPCRPIPACESPSERKD